MLLVDTLHKLERTVRAESWTVGESSGRRCFTGLMILVSSNSVAPACS